MHISKFSVKIKSSGKKLEEYEQNIGRRSYIERSKAIE
jgi:hypothetical protein